VSPNTAAGHRRHSESTFFGMGQEMKLTRVAGPRGRTNRAPAEPERSNIIAGLLRLRKEGFFQGVWVDGDVIRVREVASGQPYVLTWCRAALLVGRETNKCAR